MENDIELNNLIKFNKENEKEKETKKLNIYLMKIKC